MMYTVNIGELSFPASLQYRATPEACAELAARFEFDSITSLSGEFSITETKNCYLLEGTYKGLVVCDNSKINIKETIKVFLLTTNTQEALFDIFDDFEILEDQKFDLEEIISQYLYLYVCDQI